MRQPDLPPHPPGTTFANQTVLITGGNIGLGFETARQCLILQADRVIITVRSEAKAQDALSRLETDSAVRSTNPNGKVEALLLDLDDYQSAIDFTRKVKEEVCELDVLLCNAAIAIADYETSKSGHERSMQVNCYSHFLIVLELMPLLRATAQKRKAPSQLAIVGSYSHESNSLVKTGVPEGRSLVDHFDDKTVYIRFTQYQNSKLLVNAFIQHLARLVSADEVILSAPCPGVVETTLMHDFPLWMRAIMFVWHKTAGRSVEVGARALIYGIRVAGKESHGRFLSHNQVVNGTSLLDGEAGEQFARRVWTDVCADICKVKPDIPLPVGQDST